MPIDHGKMRVSFQDHEGERCSFAVPSIALTAANFDAQIAYHAATKTALKALMIAPSEQSETIMALVDSLNAAKPSNPNCQRETRFLITGRDIITHTARFITVPCVNLTLLSTNLGTVDLTAGEGLAVKNALDAHWINTETGNLIAVTEIRHVSRNL